MVSKVRGTWYLRYGVSKVRGTWYLKYMGYLRYGVHGI